MTPSTYGYRIPDTGDLAKGANGWFASIVYNFERLDDHNHDGVNSALLALASFSPYTATIAAAGWSVSGSGYKQTISAPAGLTEFNNYNAKFVFTAPVGKVGEIAYLHYDRISATSIDVYCNDNTAEFTAYFR